MIDLFATWTPATLGLSAGSFSTYKSEVLRAIQSGCGSNRKPGIRDVTGFYHELHEAIADSDLPKDMKLISGSFFYYLDCIGLRPDAINQVVLEDYYRHRCMKATKTEAVCLKHVKRIAGHRLRICGEDHVAHLGEAAGQDLRVAEDVGAEREAE